MLFICYLGNTDTLFHFRDDWFSCSSPLANALSINNTNLPRPLSLSLFPYISIASCIVSVLMQRMEYTDRIITKQEVAILFYYTPIKFNQIFYIKEQESCTHPTLFHFESLAKFIYYCSMHHFYFYLAYFLKFAIKKPRSAEWCIAMDAVIITRIL